MPTLSVPEDGLLLLRTPTSERNQACNSSLPAQVMRLSLAQKATEEILKSFHNKEKISIRFGKRITVQHGKKAHPIFVYAESNPSELYQRSADDEHIFYFSGKLSHRLETQKAQIDTAKSDEALASLGNSLKAYEEQKASNEARIVTDPQERRQLEEASQKGKGTQSSAIRRDRLLNTINRPTLSSPFLGATRSPAIGPTSAARSAPASLTQDQIKLNAIKIPFLHLLAIKPSTPRALAETIHATEEDCEKLLHKHGKESREGDKMQELKDKAYRELDLWKFPYPSEDDRQAAIDRAISAFDRMRISTSDPIWETLLPVKERAKGKGSELSRLKIGQAGVNGVTPKLGLNQGVATDTDTDRGKPAGKAKRSTTKTKPRSGTNEDQEKSSTLRKDAVQQLKQVHGKEAMKKKKKAPANSKFKSAEIIEDSDEELQGVQQSIEDIREPNQPLNKKVKLSTMNQPSKPTIATSTGKPSMPSSKVQPKVNGGLLPTSALTRPRSESSTNMASPRPRTDSSPHKRSPLASSPPTNATDLDNSQSSRPNTSSSTSSSPAITPHLDRSQKAKASAVSKASESKSASSTSKRKASHQISSLPKRQEQLNGNHVARPATNGTTKSHNNNTTITTTTTNTTTSSQRTRTPSSSSISTTASSSTSSRPSTTHLQSDLQLQSRRFKIQYARYQALHTKIMSLPERERDDDEVKVLKKMHTRIGELKRDIWERWEKEKGVGVGKGKEGREGKVR